MLKGLPWEPRSGEVAIKSLTTADPDQGGFSALLKRSCAEAVELGLITEAEARKAEPGECVFLPQQEHWPAIIKANRAREAARKRAARLKKQQAKAAAAVQPDKSPDDNEKLTPNPHTFRPNEPLKIDFQKPVEFQGIDHFHDGQVTTANYTRSGRRLVVFTSSQNAVYCATGVAEGHMESRPETQYTALPSKNGVDYNGVTEIGTQKSRQAKTGSRVNGSSGIPPAEEFSSADLTQLQDAIDTLLLDRIGKPIDLVMLQAVAEDLGDLGEESIGRLAQLVRKDIRKIYSYGYLAGPAGLAQRVRESRVRSDRLFSGARKQRGASTTAPTVESLRAHLENVATVIDSNHVAIAAELRKLSVDAERHISDLEGLERILSELEERMLADAHGYQTAEQLAEARRESDRELMPYRDKMVPEQLAKLEKQYLDRRLFDQGGLPRLSLFYMG